VDIQQARRRATPARQRTPIGGYEATPPGGEGILPAATQLAALGRPKERLARPRYRERLVTDERRSGSAPRPESGAPDTLSEAERVAEEWAEKTWRWILGAAARAGREGEDIRAEAQALRRNR
jgi:hypothetical protein